MTRSCVPSRSSGLISVCLISRLWLITPVLVPAGSWMSCWNRGAGPRPRAPECAPARIPRAAPHVSPAAAAGPRAGSAQGAAAVARDGHETPGIGHNHPHLDCDKSGDEHCRVRGVHASSLWAVGSAACSRLGSCDEPLPMSSSLTTIISTCSSRCCTGRLGGVGARGHRATDPHDPPVPGQRLGHAGRGRPGELERAVRARRRQPGAFRLSHPRPRRCG